MPKRMNEQPSPDAGLEEENWENIEKQIARAKRRIIRIQLSRVKRMERRMRREKHEASRELGELKQLRHLAERIDAVIASHPEFAAVMARMGAETKVEIAREFERQGKRKGGSGV